MISSRNNFFHVFNKNTLFQVYLLWDYCCIGLDFFVHRFIVDWFINSLKGKFNDGMIRLFYWSIDWLLLTDWTLYLYYRPWQTPCSFPSQPTYLEIIKLSFKNTFIYLYISMLTLHQSQFFCSYNTLSYNALLTTFYR